MKLILDACCGSKMFWFDKSNKNTVFMDNRQLECTLCDGRALKVEPDIVADFRNMPFPDESFKLVVFDPPHLRQAGKESWLAKKYGILSDDWQADLKQGFKECFRVLEKYGILVFKWNEEQVSFSKVKKLFPQQPLFGQQRKKTFWLIFMKMED